MLCFVFTVVLFCVLLTSGMKDVSDEFRLKLENALAAVPQFGNYPEGLFKFFKIPVSGMFIHALVRYVYKLHMYV